ncbi:MULTISPECIES: hypothetical protein [unclassified Oceanispirochaeta]|uniref:hypothetical protein n=1 Tax=unclassified Oceanispirochaeta TaxID=2635722 RepID=UPI000E09068B|nr:MULTISPECIES: hypothetical protein [unclassified Oceanispirochaeta]MBF9015689.1 hypothetical protein [Oceanispirochaeta sp. M2]NPD72154.1 hypothetical protein [Oceanispirochaeta sp. M1]RDG32253.1 hypothetical protein DV872_08585 [Oceanispirochaeta sp. M1]
MKKLLILILMPLVLFSACDTRLDANLFSGLKNTDNITVLEAIASGDEEIMTAVYEREKVRLNALDPVVERAEYLQTSLDVADLQSVRSKGVLLFLTLIAIEVNQAEISDVIDRDIVEDFLYEVTDRVRDVYVYRGDPTGSQKFMAILGIIVYWYYVADILGTSPKELFEAYRDGTLDTLLSTLDWENLEAYDTPGAIEEDLADAIVEIKTYIDDIKDDPEYENTPELEQAVLNTQDSFGLGL